MGKHSIKNAPAFLESAIERGTPGQHRLEEIQLHSAGYAEPGYQDPESGLVALGNWNTVTRWDGGKSTELCDLPKRIANILEKRYGVELEWSDEWTTCDECGKLVRIVADSYGWKRYWAELDGGQQCGDCIKKDPSEYLAWLEGKDGNCITIDGIDLEKHGYVQLATDLENGWYGGQNADPEVIGKSLREKGVSRYLFNLNDVGQFDINFSVYVHEDEYKLATDGPVEIEGPDPAEALKIGLQAVSEEIGKLPEGGIKYATIHADGTATARIITPEEFVKGVKP